MASYPGISTSSATLVSSVANGVGFEVIVAANPAAVRGLLILVSESYDGTNYGPYKPVTTGQNDDQEALQGTSNSFAYSTKASKVNWEVQNLDLHTLTATVSATAF